MLGLPLRRLPARQQKRELEINKQIQQENFIIDNGIRGRAHIN